MERLTNRLPNGTAYVVSETGSEGVGHLTTQRRLPEVITRLAAYEDTGLTPEEINAIANTTELRINRTFTDAVWEELRQMLKRGGHLRVLTENELNAEVCVRCGAIIPEGRQVCPTCEKEAGL